jgi:SNF2 family DNA or RNA helicase
MLPAFRYKTEPFAHQREAFELSRDFITFALLMEQGTGKTKVALDTLAYNYCSGRIAGLLLLAPNGVHRNWVNDEIPAHLMEEIPAKCVTWRSSKSKTKWHRTLVEELFAWDGLAVLAMNIDALLTEEGFTTALRFLKSRACLMAIDESTDIKTPGAKRTKRANNLGKHAVMRRILTGTPTGNGTPLDLYSQFAFLHKDIIGAPSYLAFKHEYAEWEPRRNAAGTRFEVPKVDDDGRPIYKNLDQLKSKIARRSYRKTKAEALPHLPPKLYTKHYFELSPEFRRYYDQMRDQYLIELQGLEVRAQMVIVRMLRLQQIASGYVPVDLAGDEDETREPIAMLPGENVRLERLIERVEGSTTQAIIWGRFRLDLDQIMKRLGRQRAVRYDGTVDDEDRERAKQAFKAGDRQFFVANAAAGGRGLTLNTATDVHCYTNYFGLERRQQLEDRAHRIGLKNAVLYHDYIAEESVDERIVQCLLNGQAVADLITGDSPKAWL